MSTSRVRRNLVVVLVALAVLAGLARVAQVRLEYGEWGLQPSSNPPRILFDGRLYHRSLAPVGGLPAGDVLVGHAAGGDVFGSPGSRYARTVVELRSGGVMTSYELSGGP